MPLSTRSKFRWKLAGLALLAGAAFFFLVTPGVPDEPTIRRLEAEMRLPASAGPLQDYDRYYAFDGVSRITGRPLVVGLYLAPDIYGERHGRPVDSDKPISRPRIVQRRADSMQFPGGFPGDGGIADGGCAVVHVVFDVKAGRVTAVKCNGLA